MGNHKSTVRVICLLLLIISTILCNSITHAARSDIESFVTRFYQQCLSRDPDAPGLKGWADGLESGSLSGADVANGFIFSTEFTNRNTSNADYLYVLYRAFFNREPDTPGFNGWLSVLNQSTVGDPTTRQSVLDGFLNSQEFSALCAVYGINPTSGGGAVVTSWTFTDDGVDLGIAGVSPESILLSDGTVRLYVTDLGMRVYRSTDGVTFQEETGSFPPGSDPTLIQLADGTYRMYFVDGDTNPRQIGTALSSDGLTWTKEALTGITNTTNAQAWGVPDSVKLPDGRIRLYWVDDPQGTTGDNYEVIRSAVSTDGVTFTIEDGNRTQGGYVDSYVVKAVTDDWLGLFATTPEESRLPQKIYIGTSTDGLTWTIQSDPIITVPGGNALDPTAVPLGDGSYRVYYSSTPSSDPFSGFYLKSGILRPAALTAKREKNRVFKVTKQVPKVSEDRYPAPVYLARIGK